MIKIAPSILSADFSRLGEEIKSAEMAGADLVHIDVMDGHFVPNITIGPLVVKALKKITKLPLDTHLMIENPGNFIEAFAKAGSDIISFHVETAKDPGKLIKQIKSLGKTAAIAVNPDTDISKIEKFIPEIKMLLVMTVFPGFEGQKFIGSTLTKISAIRELAKKMNPSIDIEVDGGINPETAGAAIKAGANVLVAGSAVFYSSDYKKAIESIRDPKF
jgi:ribulose-phosphate 3-epimerase